MELAMLSYCHGFPFKQGMSAGPLKVRYLPVKFAFSLSVADTPGGTFTALIASFHCVHVDKLGVSSP
jgi:hypothetical protein